MPKRSGFAFCIGNVVLAGIIGAGCLGALGSANAQEPIASSSALVQPILTPRIVCTAPATDKGQGLVAVDLTFDKSPRELCPPGTLPKRFDGGIAVPIVTGEPPPEQD